MVRSRLPIFGHARPTGEGPACGLEVPLIRLLTLSEQGGSRHALKLKTDKKAKRVRAEVSDFGGQGVAASGTVKRGALVCPECGYVTAPDRVRAQFKGRHGGLVDAQMLAVITTRSGSGRRFRTPTEEDLKAFRDACAEVGKLPRVGGLSAVPDEPLPYLRSIFNIHLLDTTRWGDLFNPRQALALATLTRDCRAAVDSLELEPELAKAVRTCLALVVDRCADYWSSLARWVGEFVANTFGRQALGIIWDFAEVYPFSDTSGNFDGALEWVIRVLEREALAGSKPGTVALGSAAAHPLPDDSAALLFTDPPYYDAVPYADLSDFFYVWLRRSLGDVHTDILSASLTEKRGEIVQLAERNKAYAYKTRDYFEKLMRDAMREGRRVLAPGGLGVVVFAHKTTIGWETQLQAMIDAGWVLTASWPIDTERPGRLRANNAAALASSVHLVCRPRESLQRAPSDDVGAWRAVLSELPQRIHEWMPRLGEEGVVGADAIFACIGPALEVFSRYSRVEKASGEAVTLKEYLEQVWAAVAKEALPWFSRKPTPLALKRTLA